MVCDKKGSSNFVCSEFFFILWLNKKNQMENKFKAVLITIFIWIVAAVGVYGFLRNAQFIGVLLISALVMVISIGLYQEIFSTLENKSKNNKKEKL